MIVLFPLTEQTNKILDFIDQLIKHTNMSQAPHLKTEPSQPTQLHLFDSPRSCLSKNRSLKDRFKMNQVELRNKFKNYLATQKFKYPLAHKNFSSEDEDSQQELNYRKVMKQKKLFNQEMQAALNQSHYLEQKKKEKERTFYLLRNKLNKVESIKQTKRMEREKIQKGIAQINRELKQQKLKYRKNIEESRINIYNSKIALEEKKNNMGDESRKEKLENSILIEQEKEEDYQLKKRRCLSLKERQKNVHLTMSRVREFKKNQANQAKLDRLFRELAEKEEIKIASSRIKIVKEKKKSSFDRASKALETKIETFRKSLGQRRLSPQPRIVFKFARKSSTKTEDLESLTMRHNPLSSFNHSHTDEASYY